jgi:hypothetical protein
MRPRWIGLLAIIVTTITVVRALTAGPAPMIVADPWWFQPADQSTVDSGTGARVFALDPFTNPADTVRALHRAGRPVFCRLWAGLWESDRPDAARFGAGLRGNLVGPADDTAEKRWLDIRAIDALAAILDDRLILCAAKGFDGVALSAVDGYAHPTGFALTPADQLAFNHRIAALAHRHRLRVAMIAGTGEPAGLLVDADPLVRNDMQA